MSNKTTTTDIHWDNEAAHRKATEFSKGMIHHNAGIAWHRALFLYAHGQNDAMHLVGQHLDRNASIPSSAIDGFKALGVEGEDAIRELVITLPF